jgi:hypothetical protein
VVIDSTNHKRKKKKREEQLRKENSVWREGRNVRKIKLPKRLFTGRGKTETGRDRKCPQNWGERESIEKVKQHRQQRKKERERELNLYLVWQFVLQEEEEEEEVPVNCAVQLKQNVSREWEKSETEVDEANRFPLSAIHGKEEGVMKGDSGVQRHGMDGCAPPPEKKPVTPTRARSDWVGRERERESSWN